MTTAKRRALILISSAHELPLAAPAGVPSISSGFFLVEMAQVLKEFEGDYDFTFATPDGAVPQLDVNSMSLAMHAIEKTGAKTVPLGLQQRRKSFNAAEFRDRHPSLVARREQEIQLLAKHLGGIPISAVLPNTEPEVADFRPTLVRRLKDVPTAPIHSLKELVARHRDSDDAFSFADFDFIHAPGGHAPMVDFRDNPWIGETLHLARENDVTISLICHAPLAVTSTRLRVDDSGAPYAVADNPFLAATISVVPKVGELLAMRFGYPHQPGSATRVPYFVDQAIKEAGFRVTSPLNISAPTLAYEPSVKLLTGNGPQAIDVQSSRLREVVEVNVAKRAARERI